VGSDPTDAIIFIIVVVTVVFSFCEGRLFSQLLNVHRVSDVRQIEMHTAEPLVPDPSPFEVETAIEKLKSYKLPGSDGIPAELI
jgi:hypothetical protein